MIRILQLLFGKREGRLLIEAWFYSNYTKLFVFLFALQHRSEVEGNGRALRVKDEFEEGVKKGLLGSG